MTVITKRFLALTLCVSVALICFCACDNGTEREKDLPDDCVLVMMERKYSSPEEPYSPEFFGAEYVEKVEALNEPGADNGFRLTVVLYLTDLGRENVVSFIEQLNSRYEIRRADLPADFDRDEISEGAIPVDDHILVSMMHEYSFPEKPYTPEYFGAEYVERVDDILEYKEGSSFDKDKFIWSAALYLTDFGRENIDSFIELLNSRDDVLAAERDYLYSYTTTLLKG